MGLAQKAEAILDLPGGTLSSEARIEVVGNRSLTVDGHCGIVAYEPDGIRLMTRSGELRVVGDGLVLKSRNAQGVTISGRVLSIEFL